ncbi:hypothetical protein [Herbihabitans rhizosphaerae]|uniref:hypothetical protein n=1 Tax=Herbihabitans rhizosphaerae TaxID=1872711 RepID=UPI00102D1C46|nr:hypothetical protein [Herbihabitans rhizosphaerae]
MAELIRRERLDLAPGIAFLLEDNGSGKPVLVEALAEATGFNVALQLDERLMTFRVPLFGSDAETAGRSKVDSASTVGFRDGAKVCSSNDVICDIRGVGPQGRYRVQTEATRGVADTSTKVSAVWELNHDGTPILPVQVVRFDPNLDSANSAPGRRGFAVPVSVQRNPGAKPAGVASLTVEASYDDGAHWHKALVAGGKVHLYHPASGHVSLRAKATDTNGNTVEQTIIRAYRLR